MASTRPCREIYRPRPARKKSTTNEDSNDKTLLENRLREILGICDVVTDGKETSSTEPTNRSSKSKALQHILSIVNDFKSTDEKLLLLDALDSAKYLSVIQMMRVVRLIHQKALESVHNAYPMTKLSFLIIEKDDSELFVESLLTCCREWFSQQGSDLKKKTRSHESWTAFVALIRELYITMQPKKMKARKEEPNGSDFVTVIKVRKHSQCLANLILDCGLLLLDLDRTKDPNYAQHVESIVNMLRCIGIYLEEDNKFKLDQLIQIFRRVLLSEVAKLSSECKKNLMEAVECRASCWIFSPNQQVYYFPYTKV